MVAPMVGLSHVAFRSLIREYLPRSLDALLFTEMLSTRRVPSEHLDRTEQLRTSVGERFLVPQLLGNDETFIGPSIRRLLPMHPWGFDINMGCPATKTLKHNWGVLLMGDKNYAADVVRATKRHSSLPISVKMRSSPTADNDIDYLLDFTEALEKAGVDWMTVHCRPRGQVHRGEADWTLVSRVARERGVPIVANGDIQTADDAISLVRDFGVDGAMIARAATARPWILWQIAHKLGIHDSPQGKEGQLPPLTPEEESREYFLAVLRFIVLLEEYYLDTPGSLRRLNSFIRFGSNWFLYGHNFWKVLQRAKSLAEAKAIVIDYRDKFDHPISQRIRIQ